MIYDIIVIGAGSGGLNMASFMNKAGFKVLLIDKSDKTIGGDCLNFGCVPSKAIIHTAKLARDAQEASKFGLKISGNIDLAKISKYVKSKQDIIREHENANYFRKRGMDVVLGDAKFVSKNEVSVKNKVYEGKKIILATGSRPRLLKIPGIEKIKYHTNETIFDLKKLPKKLLVIGGGPIGIEIGQTFQRLGSQVTVIQRGPQFLDKEEKEIAEVLRNKLEKEGLKIYFNSSPTKVINKNEIEIEEKILDKKTNKEKKKKFKLKFDELFVSIGRILNMDKLDLEKAGIKHDERKIKVDEYLRTTNKNVLLCGDVAGSYQFTHAAEMHAGVIIRNFFSPIKKKINYDNIAWVTYTDPEIATFGLNEKQIQERKIEYEKLSHSFKSDDRSIVEDSTEGKLILYISKKKRILGGSMVAKNAGELVQELILANSSKLKVDDLFKKVYPYPTATRINKSAIAKLFSKKLNDRTKRILQFMYKLMN